MGTASDQVCCVGLVYLICIHSSLLPNSPALLGKEIVTENHVYIMESLTTRLCDILKFFNKRRGVRGIGFQSVFLSEIVHLMKRGYVS